MLHYEPLTEHVHASAKVHALQRCEVLSFGEIKPHFAKEDWVLGRILERQASRFPDKPFLQWATDAPLTFAQVNATANRMAHGLADLGVRKGDKVVLFMPNSLDFVFVWFGLAKLGAVEVPVNTAYSGSFLEHQINNARPAVVVADAELVARLHESEARIPSVQVLVVTPARALARQALPRFSRIKVVDIAELRSENATDPGADIGYRDLASILYTSGTTGPSKGVMMPHAQMYFFAEEEVHLVRLGPDDVYLCLNPLFHGNAQFLTLYPCLIAGAKCVLYDRFSASRFVERLHDSQATVVNFLGVMMQFVYGQTPTPRDSGHRLRCIMSGPTAFDILEDFKRRFGVAEFVELYGMTEICAPVMTPPGLSRPRGAAGVLVSDWFDAKIVDPETDEELPDNKVGELVVRHKDPWTLNAGYYAMPERTFEATRNLWFHTGDAMKRDSQGWYYLVDRLKDSLRRRGENISSAEVEEPIREHPAVEDVAVVAVPCEFEGGEDEVKACVVLKAGTTLPYGELIAWCEKRLPYFAVPRYVEYLDQLPKTPTQKIQKNELRKRGLNGTTWDRMKPTEAAR